MKKYLSFFRIRFIAGLQYRAAAWGGIATQFAWGFMSILMYRAFYETSADSFPMTFSALSDYIWLQQALLAMFMFWYFDNEIFESIKSGTIAYELCRPCNLYSMWFVKNMAVRLSRALLRCVPILLVAALLPDPYGIRLPQSFEAGALFLISVILGFLVLVSLSMFVYISAFYTVSVQGIRMLATSVMEFLCGAVIPIPFFPVVLQRVMYALPFACVQSTPFLIYTGYINGTEALHSIGLQAIWLLLLMTAGLLLMKRSLGKVVVQGG